MAYFDKDTEMLHEFGLTPNQAKVYMIDGKFDISTIVGLWNKLINEATKKGFKRLRATGEMACFFKHNLQNELVECEKHCTGS